MLKSVEPWRSRITYQTHGTTQPPRMSASTSKPKGAGAAEVGWSPFVKLARSLKAHMEDILGYFKNYTT